MVVKSLFPTREKKGVNDTLELPTPSRRSTLSFMEGDQHTHSHFRGEEAGGDSDPIPPPLRKRLSQKEKEAR